MMGCQNRRKPWLFPAYAGVILSSLRDKLFDETFPRVCGGDPLFVYAFIASLNFSPRMRG